ncbi:hypothetical protein A2154_00315 [Candidatus Gottesmanbacteria bacterium RBG_16_43_7]|uniref:Beta-lactamase-related domain-containing protein n=1 Tax=Candidatus Gottesmanbacteria bacterium RBG_16_43_7 TaxID=1798373 RepID=A0A1F5Z970_9BACT|nr:MAG: hypothetical protein A2154_00315 [Candidatus Gottesmanbacteria bacterium RBG_16_43_7]
MKNNLSPSFFHKSNTGHTPGYALAVIRNGQVIELSCYGYANINNQIFITDATPFRLASLTKQFTSLAILQLIDKGYFKLNSKIAKLVNFDHNRVFNDINVHNLLTHTSGLPDYEEIIYKSKNNSYVNNNDAMSIIRKFEQLNFRPNSKFEYSETGYVILKTIIENISGKSYTRYLEKNIFRKLNMKNSFVATNNTLLKKFRNRAIGYKKVSGNYQEYDDDYLNFIIGNDGIYASISDMSLWMLSWRNKFLLSDRLYTKALTNQIQVTDDVSYGYGLYIDNINKMIYHTGSWVGFNNIICWNYSNDLILVILANLCFCPDRNKRLKIVKNYMKYYQ